MAAGMPGAEAQFRTRASGNWSSTATWEYFELGAWVPAVAIPDSASGDIYILPGNTITINTAQIVHKTHIGGVLTIQAGGSVNIANVSSSKGLLEIEPGGELKSSGSNNYTSEIIYGSGSEIVVRSNGKIRVGSGSAVPGSGLDGYASNPANLWENNAAFIWHSSTAMPFSGVTYFPGVAAGIKPLLIAYGAASAPGGSSAVTINGALVVENTLTLTGPGTKTFRDGITGSGTLIVNPGSGDIVLSGPAPILGGRNLQVVADDYFYIPNGLTIPADSSVSVSSFTAASFTGKGINHFTVNGTIEMGNVTIENPSGAVNINGTLKTTHPGGLEGGTITAASIVNVNANSTIEYNATGGQLVTGSAVLEGATAYYNLVFSGSGIKTISNTINATNNIRISGTAIVDALLYNFGSAAASFTMTGGRLQIGTGGLQPQMAGNYNITAGAVQFARNGGPQAIRGGTNYQYHDIEVAGDQVSINPGADIYLHTSGVFTVKSTGTLFSLNNSIQGVTGVQAFVMENGALFMCGNEGGVHGGEAGKIAALLNNIENIALEKGSTINYYRNTPAFGGSGDQQVSTSFPYQHLVFSGTGDKTPAASATMDVRGNLTGSGVARFVHNNGIVEMNGTLTAQTYTATVPLVFNTLRNNNAVNLVINSDLSVEDRLLFGTNAKLQLNAGNIHIKSGAVKTAQVGAYASAASISYTGSSKFFIERYIKTPARWQLVSIPVTDPLQTVRSSWAEGLNAGVTGTAGLGTNITGPAGAPNFDFASPGYSLKYWDPAMGAAGNFRYVLKKDTAIAFSGGYFLYVRGDRAVTAAGPFGTTTLRTSGRLFFNPSAPVIPGRYSSVGNPLASAVNLKELVCSPGGITTGTMVYLWDPVLSGNYSVGGYQTLTYNGTDFIITPGGTPGSVYPAGGSVHNTLQSGQAFFVKDPVITQVSFPETAKLSGAATATRETPATWQRINANLYTDLTGQQTLVDGVAAELAAEFNNATDAYDADKMENTNENISFYRANKKLVVERHALVNKADTFFLRIERLKKRQYSWNLQFDHMNEGLLQAWLVDSYRNISTPLQLSGENIVSFNVNDSAASALAGRFFIVLKAQGILPVSFTRITASRKQDHSVNVNWNVGNEINMQGYEVQRGVDGVEFKTIGKQNPLFSNEGGEYVFNDATVLQPGTLFYRIKGISINGLVQYSNIAKLAIPAGNNVVGIFPNPSNGKAFNVLIPGVKEQGDYIFTLYDLQGKLIHKETISVKAGDNVIKPRITTALSSGEYQVHISDSKAGKTVLKLVVLQN